MDEELYNFLTGKIEETLEYLKRAEKNTEYPYVRGQVNAAIGSTLFIRNEIKREQEGA